MRKTAIGFVAAALIAIAAAPSFATVLLSESFTYPNGDGLLMHGWVPTGANVGTDITVLAGRANGDCANTPDDNKGFAAQTGLTYCCFEVMIPDPGGSPKTIYFQHNSDGGASNFGARVYVMPTAVGATTFTFAISHSSTNAGVGVVPWTATSLSYGVSYRVVTKYDPANNTSTLWVNPANESSTSVSQIGTASIASVSAVCLRQSATAATLPAGTPSGSANWKFSVDNLGVGTTFNDACAQITPTSNPTWGQVKMIYR
jgi:hypothetical protein